MKLNLNNFKSQVHLKTEYHAPIFIQLESVRDLEDLQRFCSDQSIGINSTIDHQLAEYQEIHKMFYNGKSENFDNFVNTKILKNGVKGEYVFFGWGEKAIFNILPHDMHYELMTWRNKEKLNDNEQDIISQKRLAIVGASVGSFATKILAKSGFQNINIAEIKQMKPSNSTRMYQDSIRNIGQHKLYPLARGVFEFNPYANFNLFPKGLNEANIDSFFRIDNELVDIVIDAADDGVTKILIRDFCKKHKIPLVHGFDEKGYFIIQRYDRPELITYNEPNFSVDNIKKLKTENPKEYMMSLLEFYPGGYDNLTSRQQETLDLILNKKRGGFSQLAWEASLFASYIAKSTLDVALGHNITGFHSIDLDEVITKGMNHLSLKDAS